MCRPARERLGRVAEMFADPMIDACYADVVYVDRKKLNRVIRYWTSRFHQRELFARSWLPAYLTFFVRKPVCERHGSSTFAPGSSLILI